MTLENESALTDTREFAYARNTPTGATKWITPAEVTKL